MAKWYLGLTELSPCSIHSYWTLTTRQNMAHGSLWRELLKNSHFLGIFLVPPPTPGCLRCYLQMSSINIVLELNRNTKLQGPAQTCWNQKLHVNKFPGRMRAHYGLRSADSRDQRFCLVRVKGSPALLLCLSWWSWRGQAGGFFTET